MNLSLEQAKEHVKQQLEKYGYSDIRYNNKKGGFTCLSKDNKKHFCLIFVELVEWRCINLEE